MKKVLVVGGGASGVLVAVNLLRGGQGLAVTIAEPDTTLGRGVAYSTTDPDHLLNVPAGRMSGLVEDPAHLCTWAGVDEGAFIPRRRYLDYLNDLLASSIKNCANRNSFQHRQVKVENLALTENGFSASFERGETESFQYVVLALGNSQSLVPDLFRDLPYNEQVVRDIWREPFSKRFDEVALIGTGLTFYDAALSILRERPGAKLIGISRNGLLPQPHLKQRAPALPVPERVRASASAIRNYLDEAGPRWREAQDGIRHDLQEIWNEFPESEKAEFLARHFRWWNALRHRSAPEIDEAIRSKIDEGRIEIVAADIRSVSMRGQRIEIELGDGSTREVDQIVNCCGNQLVATQKLISDLVDSGLLRRGPLGLGVGCEPKSLRLKDGVGEVQANLFGIGPILVGELFETTAIPEIRVEAELIAKEILAN